MASRKRPDARLEVIRTGTEMFLDEGYSATTVQNLARALDMSTGNITFYFPSKQHLLAELTRYWRDFTDVECGEGDPLLCYCAQIAKVHTACRQDAAFGDFFASVYTSPEALDILRRIGAEKTRALFAKYRPEWGEQDWLLTENVILGIKFSATLTGGEIGGDEAELKRNLDAILTVCNLPNEVRGAVIEKTLCSDYRNTGATYPQKFKAYVKKRNADALEKARREREEDERLRMRETERKKDEARRRARERADERARARAIATLARLDAEAAERAKGEDEEKTEVF